MKRSQYPLSDLMKRWAREELTVEQAIGQMLLWLTDLSERLVSLEKGQSDDPSAPQTEHPPS
ncbi:MAG: hypothetical protein R3264_09705 [Anaerolineae bacterium]|nr:hypothetical protein [Anaerolineae bacterium]